MKTITFYFKDPIATDRNRATYEENTSRIWKRKISNDEAREFMDMLRKYSEVNESPLFVKVAGIFFRWDNILAFKL